VKLLASQVTTTIVVIMNFVKLQTTLECDASSFALLSHLVAAAGRFFTTKGAKEHRGTAVKPIR
jgi:hypothetical protein